MQADEALGSRELRRQRLEHEARGVGGEQRAGLHARLEARVQLLLGLEVLEDRLDDDVGLGHARAGDIRAQPRARRGVLRRIAQALVEELLRRA